MLLRQIYIKNKNLVYQLKTSDRAKKIRLTIHNDGRFVVTIPRHVDKVIAEKFMLEKADWILDKMRYVKEKRKKIKLPHGAKQYLEHKEHARKFITDKLEYFNKFYGFSYSRVTIRRQKTRWGSCSEHGNLSFNFKLYFLPEALADYIIVHELCHLRELNHSRGFWILVGQTIPDYKQRKKALDDFRFSK